MAIMARSTAGCKVQDQRLSICTPFLLLCLETKEKKLEYFKDWDNEMRSLNFWVDMLWLTLAAKMLNTNLQI